MEVIIIFDEKFKVRVSKFLRQTLELDAMIFNYIKTDGDANINGYLNRLIPNLLQLKKERRIEIMRFAKDRFGIQDEEIANAEGIINELNTIFENIYFSDAELTELSEEIWIRPSKENIAVFDEISESETELTALETSVYIRNLLNEYCRLPRYKKEQIAFSSECEITLQARDSGRVLQFRYENELHKAYVFGCLYNYLEEQGNYILCYDINLNIICRYQISEIQAIKLLEKKYKPNDKLLNLCQQYHDEGLWLEDEIIELGGDT